jgi:hypothetical protein
MSAVQIGSARCMRPGTPGKETARRSGPFCYLRIGIAGLLVRFVGIFGILAGSLALLSGFLAAALLLTRLLTRRLVLLARLVLVRHVVSFHGNIGPTVLCPARSDKTKAAFRIAATM